MWSRRRVVLVASGALCLYVGSFLLFWAFPREFSLAPPDDPQHYVVTFTDNVEVHSALRRFYWPLIQVMPGRRYYPTRDEHQRARDAHEWWTSGIRPAEPGAAPDRGGR
jgi:hypothetical protein